MPPPPGLRAQLGATRDAARRLFEAHRDLARAELAQILDEVKRLAALVGVAVAALVLVGILLPVGLILFIGEWVFGSLGWGVLDGTLLLLAIAGSAILAGFGVTGGQLARSLLAGVVAGVIVGVLLVFNVPNAIWSNVGSQTGLAIDPATRPLVVGIVIIAIAGAILGLIVGGAAGSAVPGLVAGLLLGAFVGAFSAITFDDQAGAAVGVTVALIVWPLLAVMALRSNGFELESFKDRFWPSVTIATTRETVDWVRAQAPLGRKA